MKDATESKKKSPETASASLEASAQAPSKPAEKKRTIYSRKGWLELPKWAAEDKLHKFRWVSDRRSARSDGFDPRGWSIARDPEGKVLKAADATLHKMPIDEWEAMMEFKNNAARTQIQTVLDNIEHQHDRLRFEVEKLGGSIKHGFTIERKA